MNPALVDNQRKNDEIHVFELWEILLKCKIMIFSIIFFTTLIGVLYAWMAKPIYKGSVLIEVGEVVNTFHNDNSEHSSTIVSLDMIGNLKEITQRTTGIMVTIPVGTTDLLSISMEGSDKTMIRSKLNRTIDFIMKRHQEKAKLYQNNDSKVHMTQVIGEVTIKDDPVKPKKGLIIVISLVMGIFLGVFIAFFREFMIQKEESIREFS